MEQFVEFITNHWLLALSFVTVIGLLMAGELQNKIGGIKEVGPVEATQLINHEDAVLLDVREKTEQKDGLLSNSILIPVKQLGDRITELDQFKQRPIIAYCNTGQQGKRACSLLHKQGFESIYNLTGGLLAWRSANMPVQKPG